jgi:cephalosporin hydroxylase
VAGEVWRRSAELFVEDGWFEHATWLGIPIWHLPQDLVALQQVIVEQRPRLIVTTGLGGGGRPIFLASVQELLGIEPQVLALDPFPGPEAWSLADHPLSQHVEVVNGSTDPEACRRVEARAAW